MTPAPRQKPKPRQGAVFPSQLLAANVRAARALLNLSQQDLADRMTALGHQWSRPTVSQVERAARAVSVDELYGLAHAFTVDVVSLLSTPNGPRVDLDTGLPKRLYPAAAQAMLRPDYPNWPEITWRDNKPARVEFATDSPTREEIERELGIDLDEIRSQEVHDYLKRSSSE